MQNKKAKILKNVIGVGGFPGVGKSTLVNSFMEIGYKGTFEFDQENSENDILTILLDRYFNERYDAYLLQIGFINNAFTRYKAIIKFRADKHPVFIDRTIIENIYFAEGQIKNKFLLDLYKYEHEKKFNEVAKNIGLPFLYFHLKTSFDNAMIRLKKRTENEYDEKLRNIESFKKIYWFYENMFEKQLADLQIECITIDTTKMNPKEVRNHCVEILIERGIINRILK